MVKNYLKIALRFMLRQKGFSLINLSGLTIGITSTLLIILFIQDELRYDKFHKDSTRTYRLGFQGRLEGKDFRSAQTGTPVAKAFQKEIPQVKNVLRIASWATFPVRYQDKAFTEDKLLLADSNFFHFFSFKLIEGNPDSVLADQGMLVISESAAKRYFDYKGKGDKTPIGKSLMLAQGYPVTVSGIAEDAPRNSHLHYSMILSLNSWDEANTGNWITGRVYTYFKLKPENELEKVIQNFELFLQKHVSRELAQLNHIGLDEFKSRGNDIRFFVQRITEIHLKSQLPDEIEGNSDVQYVYIFGCVAVFITLLACINFMNLSTARSASRAKEVGIRKSVGAQYGRLIAQFLMESYFYVILAVIVSVFLVMVMLPVLNLMAQKDIRLHRLFEPSFIIGTLVFTVIVGLLAGSYPAFYLTHFNPVEVLKGELRAKLRSYGIRNFLVIVQFVISTVLIIATLVVYLQLRFMQKANIGFDKGNVINLLHTKNLGKNGKAFKNELLQYPEVSSASYANRLPPNVDWQNVFREVDSVKDYFMAMYEMDVDHVETMRYSMVKGRFFSQASDSMTIILNETAARELGLENFEKRYLVTKYDPDGRKREIIGIMKDFNFQSFHKAVQPLAIVLEPNPTGKWRSESPAVIRMRRSR